MLEISIDETHVYDIPKFELQYAKQESFLANVQAVQHTCSVNLGVIKITYMIPDQSTISKVSAISSDLGFYGVLWLNECLWGIGFRYNQINDIHFLIKLCQSSVANIKTRDCIAMASPFTPIKASELMTK